jgi:hypothetical protein
MENNMETKNLEIKVTKPKTTGSAANNTVAYVKVKSGHLWASFRLIRTPRGAYFLNAFSAFSESMKGRHQQSGKQHSGYIDFAGLSKEGFREVKAMALKELGLSEAA